MNTEEQPGSFSSSFKFEAPPQSIARGDSPQLSAWADDRLAIYASLDAAMTRQIVEAVSSLSELKRQVEEDARLTMQNLSNDRENLRREVAARRLEQVQLQDSLKEVRREIEEARAQKMALEYETQGMVREAEMERGRIQHEISRLTEQMDVMGQQMQTFLQNRFNQLWENFVGSVANQEQPGSTASSLLFNSEIVPPPEPIQDNLAEAAKEVTTNSRHDKIKPFKLSSLAPETAAAAFKLSKATAKLDEPKFILPIEIFDKLEAFDDIPTMRIEGGSPVIRLDGSIGFEPFTASADEGQVWLADELNRSRQAQEQATRQRIDYLLGRRDGSEVGTPPASNQATNKGDEVQTSRLNFDEQATVIPANNRVTPEDSHAQEKQQERNELEEIAAKLGMEVFTPPSISAVRFGPGFKPRPISPRSSAVRSEMIASTVANEPNKVTTPAPRIGEIGDDNAHQFPRSGPMSPPMMPPPHMQEAGLSGIPMPPPPGGSNSERTSEGDIETRLTISNLQGLSLLMMEKVVRGLDGVHHVTVTDFRKGVLEMDVRHSPDVQLDEVLPAMPNLKLTLVERGPNSLEFLQER